MILKAGDLFRRFRVLGKVGEGGMGVVYRAHDTRLGRDVALKFVTNAGEHNPELSSRLRREAESLAALSHPNIVTIHDIDDVDDVPFLVLEWIAGRALNDPTFPRPFPLEAFRHVALSVAEALGAAHRRGIVHRDVKPSNVLVCDDGTTKVVDFGLAKIRQVDADVTRTIGTIGTIAYMSPEQAAGAEVTPASDVFSFGVLACELLTGQRPFVTSLSEQRGDLPGPLIAVVDRCLERAPDARFQSGAELALALRRAFEGHEAPHATKKGSKHEIRFCTTSDQARIAYSCVGSGPFIVRVLGHFTHLEMEWEWPDLRRFWEHLAERYTVVRYDGRGMGLSDPYAGDFTEDTRQRDLEAVLTAIGAERAILLGISEGGWTSAIYANQHPGHVTHLLLYGAYCRGARARPGYDAEEDQALVTLIRKGWGRDTPTFRQVFTSQFFRSDADPKLIAHFNELQRVSADPETAARYHESCHARGNGQELFRQVRVPTLVVHCRDDMAVNAEEGRLLASLIPGARLVLLPSGTHYFPTDRDVVTKVVDAISVFVGGEER